MTVNEMLEAIATAMESRPMTTVTWQYGADGPPSLFVTDDDGDRFRVMVTSAGVSAGAPPGSQ